jgi:hypothetical protein
VDIKFGQGTRLRGTAVSGAPVILGFGEIYYIYVSLYIQIEIGQEKITLFSRKLNP